MRTIKIYKMRNHDLNAEEDDIEVEVFENLSDGQADLLKNVAFDSVRYAWEEVVSEDTTAQWLYQRYGRARNHDLAWNLIDEADRLYWTHEAGAVKRAVERGGFKI